MRSECFLLFLSFSCKINVIYSNTKDCLGNSIYISQHGYDTSTCGTIAKPCHSIRGALSQNNYNDTIFILEEGVYSGYNNSAIAFESANYTFQSSQNVVLECGNNFTFYLELSYISFIGLTFSCEISSIQIEKSLVSFCYLFF